MIKVLGVLSLSLASLSLTGGTAKAGFFQGAIKAHFANPDVTGSVINPNGTVYQTFDNTGSAVYSIYGDGTVATVNWGANAGAPGSSTLNFFANQDVQVFGDTEEFRLGTVTLYNGTSTLESLIFGIDLILEFVPVPGGLAVDPLTLHIGIGTTFNIGDMAANADFVSIPGIDRAFFAFEDFGATAYVNGRIVGDPQFSPESFTLLDKITVYTGPTTPRPYDPNDYLTLDIPGLPGGYIGAVPTATPEPGSLALLLTGVCSVLAFRLRRSKKAS